MDRRGIEARQRIKENLACMKVVLEYLFPEGRKDANECTKEELRNLKAVF